ncbi:PTS transporter subunit EIIC, partial [Pseudomonas aeruginosa]
IMMFGLPGAALAMYFAAPKERRPMVGGMLLSVAVTAFLTGVTEPLEFLFMFLAPLLYLYSPTIEPSPGRARRHAASLKQSLLVGSGLTTSPPSPSSIPLCLRLWRSSLESLEF